MRALVAEHAAHARVGIDDAQQHAQRGGLARAVGAEHAVDRALGHRQVDPVDRREAVEALDQAARLDRERSTASDLGVAALLAIASPCFIARAIWPAREQEQQQVWLSTRRSGGAEGAIWPREARALGFAAFGVAPAADDPLRAARLRQWLAEGMPRRMAWMDARAHHAPGPQGLWPEARSVIALGMSYAPAADPLALAGRCASAARISVYAQGSDYHDMVKKALKALARWLVAEADGARARPG